ncbi:hypothetical protein ACSBOB_19120 [Mesorhizobium sp. ASY16-5R]|uniref:hypothetical protein n=1 Tax=Mesorhizobium sp. ASY16-5R TaxID=3445772 RepID=UPI003FA16B73
MPARFFGSHLALRAILAMPALCVALTSSLLAADSAAQQPWPMRFAVVRTNDTACEPTCPEWISAEGAVGAKTPALLKATLKTLGGRKLPIILFSSGGNRDAAMELGRIIRRGGLDVAVGRTMFTGCRPDEKDCRANDGKGADFFGQALSRGHCAAECTLVLAGGVERIVPDQAIFHVRLTDPKMSKAAERKLLAYLKEMGVGPSLLDALKTPPDSNLDMAPLKASGLITGTRAVESITGSAICKTFPAPDNCRVFTTMDLEN